MRLFQQGIHAREWISPSVCTYLIRQLAEDPVGRLYLRHFNLHLVPVLNPDGYEYSRKKVRLHTLGVGTKKDRCSFGSCPPLSDRHQAVAQEQEGQLRVSLPRRGPEQEL